MIPSALQRCCFSSAAQYLLNPQAKLQPMDGNTCASYVAYNLSDLAAIYPITPSSAMSEQFEEWAGKKKLNIFGQVPLVKMMQSEAGAAGALHGAAMVGALTTTFTSSQGLLLMIPNMCCMSGQLFPSVFHVASRALTFQSLSIYGDHEDITFCRSTGFALLSSSTVQEVMDLGTVAHLATVETSVPFLHFFEGFRLSHEISSVKKIEPNEFVKLVDFGAITKFRSRALNPEKPKVVGHGQRPDVLFQNNEAANPFYQRIPEAVQRCMDRVAKHTGRRYQLFDYYGPADAERVIVMMGAGAPVAKEAADYLNNEKGEKVGIITVRLYRPFSAKHFLQAIPKTCKKIAVLDRTKEYAGACEPLFGDVVFALAQNDMSHIECVGGRYGLGSKDFTPDMAVSVFNNLKFTHPKNNFTVGINDDVSLTSLPIENNPKIGPKENYEALFWGIGSDGSVGMSKSIIKIFVSSQQKHGQGYFDYSADKSNSITMSHLRFSQNPITSQYLVQKPNIVLCTKDMFLTTQRHIMDNIQQDGILLLNTPKSDEDLNEFIPAFVKQRIAEKNIKMFVLNGYKLDKELGLKGKVNKAMEAAFFHLTKIIPDPKVWIHEMEESIKEEFKLLGEDTIKRNIKSVYAALDTLREFKYDRAAWLAEIAEPQKRKPTGDKFVDEHFLPIFYGEGDSLPVSAFQPGGGFQLSTAKYEKKGYSEEVVQWSRFEKCIQCCNCAFICPRSCIRPFVLTEEEIQTAEKTLSNELGKQVKVNSLPLQMKKEQKDKFGSKLRFRITTSPMDCNGCSLCKQICPVQIIDIVQMNEEKKTEQAIFDHVDKLPRHGQEIFPETDPKSLQFRAPYMQFPGSCEGCSQTTYVRLLGQLFGNRMITANSSGCSSVWGGVYPRTPYSTDEKGRGPAWARSLFEDNAEFGYGMSMANSHRRDYLKQKVSKLVEDKDMNMGRMSTRLGAETTEKFFGLLKAWLENFENPEKCLQLSEQIIPIVENLDKSDVVTDSNCVPVMQLNKTFFSVVSHWIVGGDGWAYDIGYGGVDHVMSQLDKNQKVNIMVLDTEQYANTGGQISKATPVGAIAKFSALGKDSFKKNLAVRAMLYGHVYVASVCLGSPAMFAHTIKCLKEAEAHPGPSIILAYCNCTQHGLNMNKGIEIHKLAVESGYWPLFKFDPKKPAGQKFEMITPKKGTVDLEKLKKFVQTQARFTKLGNLDKASFQEKVEKGIPLQVEQNLRQLKLFEKF